MRRTVSCLFLVLMHSCSGNFPGFPGRIQWQDLHNDSSVHEKLTYLGLIKKKIIDTLGIHGMPVTESPKQAKQPNHDRHFPPSGYKLPQVTSYYSEPPDNFTDENILQFRLDSESNGKRVEVNNVKLLVRIKMNKNKDERNIKPKREILSKEERQGRKRRRKKQLKEITLLVSKVTKDGTPGEQVTAVTTKIRKTKFLRLTLPKEEIQRAIDSNNKTVQYFVKCLGCDKKARMITTSKKRKRARSKKNSKRKPQLMKRRPFMILQSHVVSGTKK